MAKFQLPTDLADFLRARRELEYDFKACQAGQVVLLPVGAHVLGRVWVDPEHHRDDPHDGDSGLYEVPAVSLLQECQHYDPEFILLWMPEPGCYGSWDCDHYELWLFPDASWSDIAANPLTYLNAQWFPPPDRAVRFDLWSSFPFKPGRPDED